MKSSGQSKITLHSSACNITSPEDRRGEGVRERQISYRYIKPGERQKIRVSVLVIRLLVDCQLCMLENISEHSAFIILSGVQKKF